MEHRPTLNLLLLDVDGVLVEPLAYRQCIVKTLEILGRQVGLRNLEDVMPTESDIAHMEACGIHDVWDMTNILFSAILERITFHLTGTEAHEKSLSDRLEGLETINQRLTVFQKTPLVIQKPGYTEIATELMKRLPAHPPDIALQMVEAQIRKQFAARALIYSLLEIHKAFLMGTRSVYESYGTGLFQNILLGKEEFEKTYNLHSEYNEEPLLRVADKALISQQSVAMLQLLNERPDCRAAIYTARPSLPPPSEEATEGFSPEAEIALDLCGMKGFPLVGMGMMQWLAARTNCRTEDLTKPNTTQALAALAAAIYQQNDIDLLEAAYRVDREGENPHEHLLANLAETPIRIYVFEDTVSGINPMLKVAQKLQGDGFSVSVTPMGIAQQKSKHQALSMVTKHVFGNVDFALRFASHDMNTAASSGAL
jgi:hypothetical protein